MKIVVFMNGARGERVYNALLNAGHTLVKVDDDAAVNAPVFIGKMQAWAPDLFIIAGFPQIFGKKLLSVPKNGTWNCHAGPVPQYRGGSPINWQIINGDKEIGLTLMEVDKGIDTGPVLAEARFCLPKDWTVKKVHDIANQIFPQMVLDCLDKKPMPVPQPETDDYMPQRNDEMGELDLNQSSEQAYNFIRALTKPYPGAWIRMADGKKLRIWKASVD